MTRPVKISGDRCPHNAARESCPMQCRYNHFNGPDGLTIDSWDLKCLDCGIRDTFAFRSDEMDATQKIDPERCPFCNRTGMNPGTNPCEKQFT